MNIKSINIIKNIAFVITIITYLALFKYFDYNNMHMPMLGISIIVISLSVIITLLSKRNEELYDEKERIKRDAINLIADPNRE